MIAAAAGGFYACVLLVVTPDSVFGMLVSAQAVVVTLFGGVASIWGPVIGAAILVPLAESLNAGVGQHPARDSGRGVRLRHHRHHAGLTRRPFLDRPRPLLHPKGPCPAACLPRRQRTIDHPSRRDRIGPAHGHQPVQDIRRPARRQQRQLRGQCGRNPRHHRPQRSRQNHLVQRAQRRPLRLRGQRNPSMAPQ